VSLPPQPPADEARKDVIVPLTIRLPEELHAWLRDEAFFDRTTMNAIVIEELEARRAASGDARSQLLAARRAEQNGQPELLSAGR
jgi:hypothetical protein